MREPGALGRILTGIETHGARLESVELIEADGSLPREQLVRLRVRAQPNGNIADLLTQIAEIEGVHEAILS